MQNQYLTNSNCYAARSHGGVSVTRTTFSANRMARVKRLIKAKSKKENGEIMNLKDKTIYAGHAIVS